MRALVLRGFCISPQVHAEAGQVVDLPDGLYRELLARESVAAAPQESVKDEPAPPKSKSKSQ